MTTRTKVNSVANRTLISDETNRLIRDKAPSDYVQDNNIFPTGARAVGSAHFLTDTAIETMELATEEISDQDLAVLFELFEDEREVAIVQEIRSVCGIKPPRSAPDVAIDESLHE